MAGIIINNLIKEETVASQRSPLETAPSLQSSNVLHHHLTHAILIKTSFLIY
jgi:hypothetical protein